MKAKGEKHAMYKHGHATDGISSTYHIWASMKKRCTNVNSTAYADYGGRGINLCEKWNTFEGFLEDMGERPEGMTLDRKENDLGYSKENCRWVDRFVQANNKRSNILVIRNGETKTLKQWAIELGVSYKVVHQRIKRDGYTPEQALTRPTKISRGVKW